MSESTIGSQTLPSLVASPQSTSADETSVSILSGLGGGNEGKKSKRPAWPLALVLITVFGAGMMWWLLEPTALDDGGASVATASPLPEPPVGESTASATTDTPAVTETISADALAVASEAPAPTSAVIEEATVPTDSPLETLLEPEVPTSSAAVDIGLVSPDAAEPKALAVVPHKSARKTTSAARKTPRRAEPTRSDADVDIITAIVKGAATR